VESSGDPGVRQQEYRPDLGPVSNYPSLLWHRYPGRQRRQLPRVHQMHLSKSQNHEQANLACDDERILARRRHTATSKSSTNKQTKKEVPTCLSVGHASKLKIIKIYPDLLVLIHVRRLEFIYVFVPVLTRDQLRPGTYQKQSHADFGNRNTRRHPTSHKAGLLAASDRLAKQTKSTYPIYNLMHDDASKKLLELSRTHVYQYEVHVRTRTTVSTRTRDQSRPTTTTHSSDYDFALQSDSTVRVLEATYGKMLVYSPNCVRSAAAYLVSNTRPWHPVRLHRVE